MKFTSGDFLKLAAPPFSPGAANGTDGARFSPERQPGLASRPPIADL
jgi:hypothetical protein